MLSFSQKENFCKSFSTHINAKSLQVPCSLPFLILNRLCLLRKRVLPFTSAKSLTASMTVEAALVLPIFVFFAVALLLPLHWFDRQRKVQAETEYFCEKFSQYSYIRECLGDEIPEEMLGIETDEFSGAAAGVWLGGRIGKLADEVRIKRSDVPDENGDICFEAEYREKIPYFSAVRSKIYVQAAAKRRCWVGLRGKLKVEEEGNNGDTGEQMVYVGAGMGRYHLSRNCHYISNEYESVRVKQLEGKRIPPCSVCAKDCQENDVVYVTVSGEHYHKTKSCRSMISYVREVPLSEVRHLGACSYCSGKR